MVQDSLQWPINRKS